MQRGKAEPQVARGHRRGRSSAQGDVRGLPKAEPLRTRRKEHGTQKGARAGVCRESRKCTWAEVREATEMQGQRGQSGAWDQDGLPAATIVPEAG